MIIQMVECDLCHKQTEIGHVPSYTFRLIVQSNDDPRYSDGPEFGIYDLCPTCYKNVMEYLQKYFDVY